MTRTRHDRQDDHFGFDLDSNILLSAGVAGVAAGEALTDALAALDAAVTGGPLALIDDTRVVSTGSLTIAGTTYPVGTDLFALLSALNTGGTGSGMTEYLTGNDARFKTGLGNWTGSGGTRSWDTSTYYLGNTFRSLKWTGMTVNDYIEVPLTGTFVSGREYQAVIAITHETDPGFPIYFELGVPGTDSRKSYFTPGFYTGNNGHYAFYIVRWVPTANRTTAKLRLTCASSSGTLHLAYARVADPGGSIGLAMISETFVASNATNPGQSLIIPIPEQSSGLAMTLSVSDPTGFANHGLEISDDDASIFSAGGNAWISAQQDSSLYMSGGADVAAADKAYPHVEIDVGPDYLDLNIAQKDAGTIQFFSHWGDYDFELADGAAGTWRHRAADNGIAIPSLGMLPAYASAPGTPTERQAYYDTTLHQPRIRNNARWVPLAPSTVSIGVGFDGGGSDIAAGQKLRIRVPFDCVITGWTLMADAVGSATIDIWKDVFANYPPVVGDSITAAAKPTLSAADHGESSTLTGWVTTLAKGDVLIFNVDSCVSITQLSVQLTVERTS